MMRLVAGFLLWALFLAVPEGVVAQEMELPAAEEEPVVTGEAVQDALIELLSDDAPDPEEA
jgi:hypothetical protein